ncbi:hypothetical protein B0H13DRAFT_1904986 [Mycena leptocephala]|nr:hypothetical protein B0H13DRAFT_1904986 [Mycena leptocephala]
MEAWRTRDRKAIKNYDDHIRACNKRDARLACSKATASLRSACYHQFEFSRWLEQHETGKPPGDPFGGADHYPGLWHSYRNSDGSWGPWGGTMDVHRWVPDTCFMKKPPDTVPKNRPWGMGGRPWGPFRGLPGPRDPSWDGVPVPKTPGKARRRKLRRRVLLEQAEREETAYAEQMQNAVSSLPEAALRAAGWGVPAWGVPDWGWGPDWSQGGQGLWTPDAEQSGSAGGYWEAARSRL